ncbi:hypothetical protein ACFLTZ_06500 [Chloroflexota bacterium]
MVTKKEALSKTGPGNGSIIHCFSDGFKTLKTGETEIALDSRRLWEEGFVEQKVFRIDIK